MDGRAVHGADRAPATIRSATTSGPSCSARRTASASASARARRCARWSRACRRRRARRGRTSSIVSRAPIAPSSSRSSRSRAGEVPSPARPTMASPSLRIAEAATRSMHEHRPVRPRARSPAWRTGPSRHGKEVPPAASRSPEAGKGRGRTREAHGRVRAPSRAGGARRMNVRKESASQWAQACWPAPQLAAGHGLGSIARGGCVRHPYRGRDPRPGVRPVLVVVRQRRQRRPPPTCGVTVNYSAPRRPRSTCNGMSAAHRPRPSPRSRPGPGRLDPDADALSPSIKKAVDAGIPVVSMNSGSDVYKSLGILTHVGQTEFPAGHGAGERFKDAGVKNAVCINQEVGNQALTPAATGFTEGLGSGAKSTVVQVDLNDQTGAASHDRGGPPGRPDHRRRPDPRPDRRRAGPQGRRSAGQDRRRSISPRSTSRPTC